MVRHIHKSVSLILVAAALLFLFNNCSDSSFESASQNSNVGSQGNPPPGPPVPPPVVPPPVVPVDLAQLKDAPASFELQDWTSGSAVSVGTISLNSRLSNLTFDDADLKAQMGEVLVLNSNQSLTWKGFEFGGIAFVSANLGEGNKPLYQTLFGAKPAGRWATYPFADTFNPLTDVTIPPAFKVIIRDYENRIIGRLEMQDGKPINDPSLSQTRTATQPLRPFFNCGMLLPWSNTRPRLNPNMKQIFPGFKLPPESRAKSVYSANAAIPLLAPGAEGRSQANGLNNWFYLPQWPLNSSVTTMTDSNLDAFIGDPDRFYTGGGAYAKAFRATGWDYEPGSISGHDWFTGPGGIRFDRTPVPAPLAYLISDPNYRRLKDNRPILEMADAWGKAYFNHSSQYLTDVKNFTSIMSQDSTRLDHSYLNAYYGRHPFVTKDKGIDLRAISNGDYREVGGNGGTADSFFLDKFGNRFWGGYAIDDHHSHQTPYWHVLLMNSPMHVVASRSAFNAAILGHLNSHNTTMRSRNEWSATSSYANFNSRVQAWRWLHYTMAWKIGTSHSLGISRAAALKLLKDDLYHYHDSIMLQIQAETTNPYHVAIKNLGMPVEPSNENGQWVLRLGSAIAYYHGPVFLLMKKTGLWDELRKDAKCKASLDFVFNSLSKYSIDFILDTNGRAEDESGNTQVTLPVANFAAMNATQIPKSWAEWSQKFPAKGQENWIKKEDGSYLERYAAQHIRAQWAIMVRDWFPEMNYPRAAQAAAAYENFYAERENYVNSRPTPTEKSAADFSFMTISYGPILKPGQ